MENKTAMPVMNKKTFKFQLFSLLNGLGFALFCFLIIIPLWKVLVDSLDLASGYGMKVWPTNFGLAGYQSVFSNPTLLRPFFVSVITTVSGTLMGLTISTLGAYVLIQWDMPGRAFLGNILLFTMIFSGGMIPSYIVMKNLGLVNTLWVVILMPAINVYNLVLMRNFFEGIPASLFESATLDGCTPMQIFYKIVLPLSKAALASIGLMFAVSYWNDYTNYKLYITKEMLYNFQMKLRSIMMGSDLPSANGGATENTVQNAAVIVAILPFMILYPFLQKYFVKGINIGAVKE
ncbi:MAG: carbohydrate ABC transporter permease [bacterium]|nr:carbohydrate ABC transporter permease [bacterium]